MKHLTKFEKGDVVCLTASPLMPYETRKTYVFEVIGECLVQECWFVLVKGKEDSAHMFYESELEKVNFF